MRIILLCCIAPIFLLLSSINLLINCLFCQLYSVFCSNYSCFVVIFDWFLKMWRNTINFYKKIIVNDETRFLYEWICRQQTELPHLGARKKKPSPNGRTANASTKRGITEFRIGSIYWTVFFLIMTTGTNTLTLTKSIRTGVHLIFYATKFQNWKFFFETAAKVISYGICRFNSLGFFFWDNVQLRLFCCKTEKKNVSELAVDLAHGRKRVANDHDRFR